MKKILALLLAVVMFASLFAGCNNTTGNTDPTDNSVAPTDNTDETPAPTEGNEEPTEGTTGDVVTLKWVTVGNGMPENYDAWKANLDKYLEEKIGVHLEMEVVAWGDWDNRRNVMVNANDGYDIMFTNLGTYQNDVRIGAFLDITDLVQSTTPTLYSTLPTELWNGVAIKDRIYAVPTWKDSSVTQYFVFDKAKAEQYIPNYSDVKELSDLTEGLTAMKDATNEAPFVLNKQGLDAIFGAKYDGLTAGLPTLGVSYTDSSRTVVCTVEQEDTMNELKTIRSWYEAGIINADAATLAENPKYRACYVAQGWSLAADTTWGPGMGVDAVAVQWGPTVMGSDTIQGSMNCISASSKNPEKALQLLELVNTDSYVRDSLQYGLEGEDWEYTTDGKLHRIKTDWPMAGYTQGNYFIRTQLDTEVESQDAEIKALNEGATMSPVLGFAFDTSNVADQLTACIEIYNRYKAELLTGTLDPEEQVAAMMEEMRSNGFDEIVAEAQAQIDAYFAG